MKILFIISLSLGIACAVFGYKTENSLIPKRQTGILENSRINLADPFVLKYKGVYYLYGTADTRTGEGIPVYTSVDKVNWKGPVGLAKDGLALSKGFCYGDKGFWAPYVLYKNNQFYMYYTANEQIAVATSRSPLGPFTQKVKTAMHPETKEIDPHVYFDDNGKGYFYFVRFDKGNKVYGAELNADLQSINEKTIRLCIDQSQAWEIASGKDWPVTEAPAVLKHKATYYLFYSGNDVKHANYNMGYATSKSPLGPWKKFENNPLISKTSGVPGTAGGDFLIDSDHKIYLFYHQHFSDQQFSPRSVLFNKCTFRKDKTIAEDLFSVDTLKSYPAVNNK